VDADSFISQYGPDWQRLDAATRGGQNALAKRSGPELDEILRLYLRISGQLAEVRARYRDPQLTDYLTGLIARAHGAIYGARSQSRRDLLLAMTVRYRDAVRSSAPFIWTAAAIFVAVGAVSMVWVAGSAEARAGLLPPQAEEAIRSFGGEPRDFGAGPGAISTLILVNNVQVAFLGFALGISLGIGTMFVLVFNAVNIGVLAGAFMALGKGAPFWALIVPHGLLELTAIFIACGVGFRLGWSIVDPGDRRRRVALAETARESVLVIAGVVPAFVLAAFIEGYVTGSSMPAWAEIGIGIAVWLAYCAFLLWPARRQRRPYALARRYSSASVEDSSPGTLSTTAAPS
jgi:uncharacterized membrane protein SpoIIM required for sporulation